MPKHTLFVCKSCHCSSEELQENQSADGTVLLKKLNILYPEQFESDELEIQPVGCLWTCSQPCAVAFSAPHKPTYLFTNVPASESATALLQFGKIYLNSNTGDVPWKQFPDALQAESVSIAKVPPVV